MTPSKKASPHRYLIPENLLKPLWLRSRESLIDNGLIYDPIAASACQRCQLAPECFAGNIDQKQLLHVTLAYLCDVQVKQFLASHPDGWIINVGAGLDTRFYRIDNGRCHWIELDITEHLLWRQKLFHANERYFHRTGSVHDLSWLDTLPIPDSAPVLIVCEYALLDCQAPQIPPFVQALGRHFDTATACLVLAGDLASKSLGQALGAEQYAHGYADVAGAMLNVLPWAQWVNVVSPLDGQCGRWKRWQRWLRHFPTLKPRLTPVIVQLCW